MKVSIDDVASPAHVAFPVVCLLQPRRHGRQGGAAGVARRGGQDVWRPAPSCNLHPRRPGHRGWHRRGQQQRQLRGEQHGGHLRGGGARGAGRARSVRPVWRRWAPHAASLSPAQTRTGGLRPTAPPRSAALPQPPLCGASSADTLLRVAFAATRAPQSAAIQMHRIAELLFYCSVGNLKAVKKLVRRHLGASVIACGRLHHPPQRLTPPPSLLLRWPRRRLT